MLKQIKVNTKALESMLFIWACLCDKEKITDEFFVNLAESPEMEAAYSDDFDVNGFRKVLSAICNRELLSDASKQEKRFWNNNMWMTEDLEFTKMMVEPLKQLNLDGIVSQVNQDFPYTDAEVIFYPGTMELAEMRENKLYVNFFKVKVDLFDPEAEATIENQLIPDFILSQLNQ